MYNISGAAHILNEGWHSTGLGRCKHFFDGETWGKVILKWCFTMWDDGHGLNYSCSREGHVAGDCEWSHKPLDFINAECFLTS